jgi:hypothetical protein
MRNSYVSKSLGKAMATFCVVRVPLLDGARLSHAAKRADEEVIDGRAVYHDRRRRTRAQ